MFPIYLPIAEMTVPAEAILGLGALVGFLSAIFGVGGGFLATPLLMFLGVPPSYAVGTQANQLVATSLAGVIGHWRRGNVDWKLGSVMLIGSVGGSLTGIAIFSLLRHWGQIDVIIGILYVVLMGSVGSMMFAESLRAVLRRTGGDDKARVPRWAGLLKNLPYQMSFPRSNLYISAVAPVAIGFVGGMLVAILGVGGGFLLVPAMIYILGMPALLVAGTSLFQILVTTFFTTILHALTNGTVDIVLAALLITGGMIGTRLGMRVATHIKGAPARLMLATLLLLICVKIAFELAGTPAEFFTTENR